jgi:hypothetical protein
MRLRESPEALLQTLLLQSEAPPAAILAESPDDTVISLYDKLKEAQNNLRVEIPDSPFVNVSKIFATSAILSVLDQFQRAISAEHDDASVSNAEKLQEATGGEDKKGKYRYAHTVHKLREHKPQKRADREYVALGGMLKLLNYTRGNSQNRRRLANVILQTLLRDEEILLDDGEIRPAHEVFVLAPCTFNGSFGKTYFSDIQAKGYLLNELNLLPKKQKDELQGYIPVNAFSRKLGRGSSKDTVDELRAYLAHLLTQGDPIEVSKENFIDPHSVLAWRRNYAHGGSRPILYANAEVLEPFVRKQLICGKTPKHDDWLNTDGVLEALDVSRNKKTALNAVLFDLWKNHGNEETIIPTDGTIRTECINDLINVCITKQSATLLTALNIKGNFYVRPDAVGTLVTKDNVISKAEEIEETGEQKFIQNLRKSLRKPIQPAQALAV